MAESNDSIRVIVIRGAPPNTPLEGKRSKPASFAAGADISEFLREVQTERNALKESEDSMRAMWDSMCESQF